MKPPVAPRHPSRRTLHGVTITDDYAWLKDANWQEVLRDPSLLDPDIRAYLEAENAYAEEPAQAIPLPLQKKLVAEMRGRLKEDDSSVPTPDGPFAYLWKFREGGQHERSAACRATAARCRRLCSTATRWRSSRPISSSAARGIRPTIN
jgi:oligopeptidase B